MKELDSYFVNNSYLKEQEEFENIENEEESFIGSRPVEVLNNFSTSVPIEISIYGKDMYVEATVRSNGGELSVETPMVNYKYFIENIKKIIIDNGFTPNTNCLDDFVVISKKVGTLKSYSYDAEIDNYLDSKGYETVKKSIENIQTEMIKLISKIENDFEEMRTAGYETPDTLDGKVNS